MSYILDALRRADAERDRGDVPHLHTQAVPAGEMDAEEASAARPWLWLAAGLAIGLLVALAWVIGGRSPSEEVASGVVPQALPAPVPVPAPAEPAPAPAPTPSATTARAGPENGETPETASAAPPSIVPRSLVAAASPVAPRAAPTVATPREATPREAASREAAITQLAELPEDVRRELPRLAISGSMYSETPASRMLIVNGQLLREGDKISPTITLEQIRLRSAVLTYKNYRYEIGF